MSEHTQCIPSATERGQKVVAGCRSSFVRPPEVVWILRWSQYFVLELLHLCQLHGHSLDKDFQQSILELTEIIRNIHHKERHMVRDGRWQRATQVPPKADRQIFKCTVALLTVLIASWRVWHTLRAYNCLHTIQRTAKQAFEEDMF